jgi:5-hydroxyisourate hydrolase-like protein (transthyretin family)
MKTFPLISILFVLIFFLSGCNRASISGLVPVEGIVKYKDIPIDGATVVFIPSQNTEETRLATTITEPNGTFKMMTLDGTGVLPGSYNVTFSKKTTTGGLSMEEVDHLTATGQPVPKPVTTYHLPKKYGIPETSGFTIEIPKTGKKNIVFELND